MSRLTRHFAVATTAWTLLGATSLFAQATDSTRAEVRPPAPRGRMYGPPGREADAGPRARRRGPGDMQGPGWGRGRGDFGPGGRGMMARNAGMPGVGGARWLLKGITLSTEQEKALRSTQAKHLQTAKPLMIEAMSARMDEQLARLNGDQKALDAATARSSATRARLDSLRAKRSPTADLRSVLTPDQTKILDQNMADMADGRRDGMGPRGPGDMGPRGFRPGAGRPDATNDVRPRRRPGRDESEGGAASRGADSTLTLQR